MTFLTIAEKLTGPNQIDKLSQKIELPYIVCLKILVIFILILNLGTHQLKR